MAEQEHRNSGGQRIAEEVQINPSLQQTSPGIRLFGFEIKRRKKDKERERRESGSFIPREDREQGDELHYDAFGGAYAGVFDTSFDYQTNRDLILQYRKAAEHPEADAAIEDIINESIVGNYNEGAAVTLIADNVSLGGESIKKTLIEEFQRILEMLNFNQNAYEIFRRWYIDGRLYYHIIIDSVNPKENGIVDLRSIDPVYMQKVRNLDVRKDPDTGIDVIRDVEEYYLYRNQHIQEIRIAPDAVSYVTSGLLDAERKIVRGYLHKALKPINQLRTLEDALVIYRLARAPERRVFYVDVGNLPTKRASEYLRRLMSTHHNKINYNHETGELMDRKHHMAMTEDYWLPRMEGGRGTEVDTLSGGCFAMDTRVPLLDGRERTIAEISDELKSGKDLWAYSCDPDTGEFAPGLISWAGVTQKSARVIRVTLDSGDEVTCTPEHRFCVYGEPDGVRADELTPDMSLIPLNRRKHIIAKKKYDYEQIFCNKEKIWKFTHREVSRKLRDEAVFDWKYAEENGLVKTDTDVDARTTCHHIDFNRFNNNPDNLAMMNHREHLDYHSRLLLHLKKDDPESYDIHCKRKSKSLKKYCRSLNDEQKRARAERSRKHLQKAGRKSHWLRQNDADFRQDVHDKVMAYWTDDKRQERAEQTRANNLDAWSGKSGKKRRANHRQKQKLEYSRNILNAIVDAAKGKTTHQMTIGEITEILNSNAGLLSEFRELNRDKSTPNWNGRFMPNNVKKIPLDFGYSNWREFRKYVELHNHRIREIVWMDEPIEVGTLTIDQQELHHDYHNFAISPCIYVKNSHLDEIEDVIYFQKKLYKALNVPVNRLEQEMEFSLGRSSEITRDELKFQKFINRLRKRFSMLFFDLLEKQVLIKEICTEEEWEVVKEEINFDFQQDVFFSELKDAELTQERLSVMSDIEDYVGKFFSKNWVRRNVLRMNEQEIERMKEEMEIEKAEEPEDDDGW